MTCTAETSTTDPDPDPCRAWAASARLCRRTQLLYATACCPGCDHHHHPDQKEDQ